MDGFHRKPSLRCLSQTLRGPVHFWFYKKGCQEKNLSRELGAAKFSASSPLPLCRFLEGQREDGGPFVGSGKGRGWPLLTGERGHYEVASGRDAGQYVRWLEGFATPTHLLPEQVWGEDDRPEQHLKRGRPTGSAVPLLWAHAEYIKLLRSVRERRVFDLIPEAAHRYIRNRSVLHNVQVWSIQHPSGSVQRGRTLRIHSENAFEVRSSLDNWATTTETHSTSTNLGIDYCDIVIPDNQRVSLRFALFWTVARRWEGRDFEVACTEREGGSSQ
jgi:glucoamylase